jgi:hypothetical protein
VAVAVSVVIGLPVIPAGSLNGPVLATNEEPGEQAGRPAKRPAQRVASAIPWRSRHIETG